LLEYIVPDFVHVLQGGKIVRSGDRSLALELEREGYGDLGGVDGDGDGDGDSDAANDGDRAGAA